MSLHRTYLFLDEPAEIMGVPIDQALAFIIPVGAASGIGYMGYGLLVGAVVFTIYRKISNTTGFSMAGHLMKLGIKPKGCLPTPASITYYSGN